MFFDQFLRPQASWAKLLGPQEREGIPVFGARVGFHEKDGQPFLVYGYQTTDLSSLAPPALATRQQAWSLARSLALFHPVLAPYPETVSLELAQNGQLFLEEDPAGTWRLVWHLPAQSHGGEPYPLVLDAATGQILRLVREVMDATCSPFTNQVVQALAYPQNPALSPRWLWATTAPDRAAPWTHEAHLPQTATRPGIEIYFAILPGESGTAICSLICPNTAYGVLPLTSITGTPAYTDVAAETQVPGKEAGDALWNTYQTMNTFWALFRWKGFDGLGSPARVVVRFLGAGWDNAQFVTRSTLGWGVGCPTSGFYAPLAAVEVGKKLARPLSHAAALDVMAPEWGHGLIAATAGFPYSGIGAQLHEGFADVIGYLVEWANQPPGSGAEKADWTLAEDSGPAVRRVDVDDGNQEGPCNPSLGECDFAFHKDDDPGLIEAHARGNQLAVAYRLLVVGGQNPVCTRLPQLAGCDLTVPGLGLIKASKVFFYTLAYYAVPSTQWEDLPELAKGAAFALFAHCSSTCRGKPSCWANLEQTAAEKAFAAIGYPGDGTVTTCEP